MTDHISLTGVVATTPRSLRTAEGLAITSFRLASAQRRWDRAAGTWSDGETNWYTVTCFRSLAENAAASVAKGERVVVAGRLRVRPWESGDKSGTSVEVDADALGHDLLWGRTAFTRTAAATAPSGPAVPAVAEGQEDPVAPDAPGASGTSSTVAPGDQPTGEPEETAAEASADSWAPAVAEPAF